MDATRHIIAAVDLHDNEIRRFAVENVDELPEGYPGRLVTYDGALYFYDGSAWVAEQSGLDRYQPVIEKGAPMGYASLDVEGMVPLSQLHIGHGERCIPVIAGELEDGRLLKYDADAGGLVPGDATFDGRVDGVSAGRVVTVPPCDESEVTVIHGLGTYDVICQLRSRADAPPVRVGLDADVRYDSPDTLTVSFDGPVDEEFAVMLISLDGTKPSLEEDGAVVVPFEDATELTVTHDAGVPMIVQLFDADGDQMFADVTQDTDLWTMVEISFGQAESGTAVLVPGTAYDFKDEERWTVTHGFGRCAVAQTYDVDGDQMFVDMSQDASSVWFDFDGATSGTAVVAPCIASVKLDDSEGGRCIVHNLGRFAIVQVFDEEGDEIKLNVLQKDEDHDEVEVTWNGRLSGRVVVS